MGDRPQASENRRFPRLKESCGLRYRRIQSDSLPDEGVDALTVNISGGGVCFEADEAVEPGALLAIELSLEDFDSAVVSLGRAVWCEPRADGNFEVGMEFWWIGWGDDGAQKAISEYIKNELGK